MKYLLTLDAGTSNSRAVITDKSGTLIAISEISFLSHFPNQGWIEQNPKDLWETQLECIIKVMQKAGLTPSDLAAIGITNQRETTIIWDRETGKPIWNAIVWNDRRTKDECTALKTKYEKIVQKKTGLFIESYFSASKIAWILNKVDGSKKKAKDGKLCFGTVNTWLLWHLTKGKVFATDVSNASRTLLFNIHTLKWDQELLDIFDIPKEILPEVRSSSETYGYSDLFSNGTLVPISSMIGDQQAALYGHGCIHKGDLQCTYGTACSLMMNIGDTPINKSKKLLTTIAWQRKGEKPIYALEGIVYSAGSLIQWLRDSLGIIKTASEIEGLAYSVPDSGGTYFVPAINGLSAPYWNDHAKGNILGITSSTNIGHIARASLEGIAYQVTDIVSSMIDATDSAIHNIKCGGGMSRNLFLMQMQSDLLHLSIKRSANVEMTAIGCAFLAGLSRGQDPLGDLLDRMKKNWLIAIKATEIWANGYA